MGTGLHAPAGKTALRIAAGSLTFTAMLEENLAPETCAAFRSVLPFESKLIHARWSGEAAWIPLGDRDFGLGHENPTSHPAPGQVLLYPGGLSETEILLPYGGAHFMSIVGQLAGNHFMTITGGPGAPAGARRARALERSGRDPVRRRAGERRVTADSARATAWMA